MLHSTQFWKGWNESCWTFEINKRSILSLSSTKFCCKLYTQLQKNASQFLKKLGGCRQIPCRKRGVSPLSHSPPQHRWHRLLALPSLLTPKMIFMHLELEEHTECAEAHYLRKAGLYNNNNTPSVLYPPVIFAISMCIFDFSCSTMTILDPPLTCLILKWPVIRRDVQASKVKLYYCIIFKTCLCVFSPLRYWKRWKIH